MRKRFQLTEQNYQYLFDNASEAIWVHDVDRTILVANKASEKLTGYTPQELVGMNVTKFLTAEFLESAREVRRKLLEGETIEQPYEQRLIRKGGITGIVEMATSLVIAGGKVIGFQNIARDVTEERQMQENRRYYVQQITRAQEDERKRIARELHDDAAPLLLLLLQRMDSITSRPRSKLSEYLKVEMEDLRRQALASLEGLRRCAQDLRPRILDDLGLIPALEWMADTLGKNYGIDTRVEVAGTERTLPAEVQLLLFRIAQEALSNIRKHAQASLAVIKLEFESNKVRLTVSDNGKGFEVPGRVEGLASNGKLGIMGMHERARLLGGSLKIQSHPGRGTQVIAEVPQGE